MELFKLFGRVLVEVADAIKDLAKVEDKAKETGEGLKKVDEAADEASEKTSKYAELLEKWAGKLKALFSVAAVAKILQQIWLISDATADQGDAIDKASQKLGVSSRFYQEWAYVLQRNGTSIDQVGESIFELSEKVGKGDEEILGTFERLGIGVEEILTATPEEIWEKALTALFQIDSLSERAALSTKLFGDKAKQLGPLLNTSAEDVENLKKEVNDLGGVMPDSVVKMSAAYADAKLNYETAWQGVKNHFAENTLPGMTLALQGFTEFLTGDFESAMEDIGNGIKSFFMGTLETLYTYTESVWSMMDSKIEEAQYWLGSLAGMSRADVDAGVESYYNEEFQLPNGEWITQSELDDRFRHATGIPFIPRDNYPANLHYGERVLTRQEAEEYNSGKGTGGGINQTINISTVSQTPAQTAAAIRAAFETARWAV